MTLRTPSYVPSRIFEEPSIRYAWDDWDVSPFYLSIDEELMAEWANLAEPAICGLTIAISEWVFFRQRRFESDPTPMQCLEAAWCANIDRRYSEGLEVSREKWLGPVRGPLRVAMNLLHSTLYEAYGGADKPVEGPSLMSNLTEHVCGITDEFREWRTQCIARLQEYYVAPPPLTDLFDEQLARIVVPREVFDLQRSFHPDEAPLLVDQFLRGIDFRSNPFLLTPEAMLQEGFEGIPYRLNSTRSK